MPLTVGIPKEIKIGERRVSLTPNRVRVLSENQIQVFVEKNAGILSGFPDQDYEHAGACLVAEREELWQKADLIKKVKEPVSDEFGFFRSQHIIFTYLHLASPSERPLIDALVLAQATAIAYETIEQNGETPLLKPMSEVAGVLAAYFSGIFRNHVTVQGNKILGLEIAKSMMNDLAAAYPATPKNFPPGQVVILGGGHVGKQAARTADRMGGTVFLSEIAEGRRKQLEQEFKSAGLSIQLIDPRNLDTYEKILTSSEVVIACVHAAGKRAPTVIDSALLKKISEQKRKVILDIAIDQGGNVAESSPTDYETPLYVDSLGNLRFSVTNVPSLCGRGASRTLEKVSLDYTLALTGGLDQALRKYPELRSGINILKGVLLHPAVCEAHRLSSKGGF